MRPEAGGPPPTWPELTGDDLRPPATAVRWHSLEATGDIHYTYTGRAGIFQYLTALRRSLPGSSRRCHVLVPAFHCPSVVDPVLHAGFEVRYYGITEQLGVNDHDLLTKIDEHTAAVLFIRFFGIGAISPTLITAVRAAGARVLSDCSHSFLLASPVALAGGEADATVYSFWKTIPSSTVGGGVWCTDVSVNAFWPQQSSAGVRHQLQFLRDLLGELLKGERQPAGTELADPVAEPAIRKSCELAYPYAAALSYAKMPLAAGWILRRVDLGAVARIRRDNYRLFCEHLVARPDLQPAAPLLGDADVPWGVPVVMHNRGERDYLIRARGVPLFTFGEVLHPSLLREQKQYPAMVEAAQFLRDNLLVFAIHQHLGPAAVRHYAGIVNRFMESL